MTVMMDDGDYSKIVLQIQENRAQKKGLLCIMQN